MVYCLTHHNGHHPTAPLREFNAVFLVAACPRPAGARSCTQCPTLVCACRQTIPALPSLPRLSSHPHCALRTLSPLPAPAPSRRCVRALPPALLDSTWFEICALQGVPPCLLKARLLQAAPCSTPPSTQLSPRALVAKAPCAHDYVPPAVPRPAITQRLPSCPPLRRPPPLGVARTRPIHGTVVFPTTTYQVTYSIPLFVPPGP